MKETLLQYSSGDLDMDKFRISMPTFANKLCTNVAMRPEIDSGINVRYEYFGSDGVHIGDVEVTRSTCATYPIPTGAQ